MEASLRVAYILHRFPHLTETFIMHEMNRIRDHKVELFIFSLLPPKHDIVHDQVASLLPCTHYSPLLSWKVIQAQLYFLRRSSALYLRVLAKVIRLTYREPAVFLYALAIFPKSVYLAQQMEAFDIDHIHAHFVWLGGIAAGVVADLIGITFTIQPHAFGLFSRNQQDVRLELENASKIVTVSRYHRGYIADLCPGIEPEDIEIVHLGIEEDYFQPASKLADGGPIHILSVGRLVNKKGHVYLIEACRLLADRGLNFHCQIVGNGPDHQALQTQIERKQLQDHVRLLGALSQGDILRLYQTSDIFALPCVSTHQGDQDGMPYVLIEAMACGLPVVTTPLSGIPDLVDDGKTGLFVQEQNVANLSDALARLIVDERLRKQLGTQARQKILTEFRVQSNTAKLAAIFRQVSQQRHKTTVKEKVVPKKEVTMGGNNEDICQ